MTSALTQKLTGVRDFKKILETSVKEIAEAYAATVSQILVSNPLDRNITSIYEYKLAPDSDSSTANSNFPLSLEGGGLGMLSLTRQNALSEEEVNSLRIMLAELAELIRHAQINELVQRDTFRNTFLVEINNVMNYSLGLGDALFMVVNILGKVLNASRCLFICTDDTHAGWKCYEFWQREKVKSLEEFAWPTTDSPIVAQSLLCQAPLVIYEGQNNSYLTPVQEELQLIDTRSLLSVSLRSEKGTHGCIIVQQCDSRRAWTRGDMDMVQKVADTVAEALAKLPEEKKAHEPIMRLHQREVVEGNGHKEDKLAMRQALKGALGNQSIPSARKSTAKAAPAKQAPQPIPVAQTQAAMQSSAQTPMQAPPQTQIPGQAQGQDQVQTQAQDQTQVPTAPIPFAESTGSGTGAAVSLNSLLGDLQVIEPNVIGAAANASDTAARTNTASANSAASDAPTFDLSSAPINGDAANMSVDADAASAPASPEQTKQWGALDSIPTPTAAPVHGGLGGVMLSRAKAANAGNSSDSSLSNFLHKGKNKPETKFVEGPPLEIDEVAAEAKLKEILSSSSPTSDYIFATPGLNAVMLGRIDGWVSEIEQKDKYAKGHAKPVAEYCVAIGRAMDLPLEELTALRIAALVHDVGKLGVSQQLLQRPDDELSDEELIMVMSHPVEGAKLLNSIPELAHLAPIVRAHHEEYNGNGYPDGLAGEDIPLLARIIRVADAYHGMVSPMVYPKPIMTTAEAVQSMKMSLNKEFDASVVEAFDNVLKHGHVAEAAE